MSDLSAFREEAEAFMKAAAPAALVGARKGRFDGFWGGRVHAGSDAELAWRDAMVEKGWTAPTWPKAYGGGGLAKDEARIIEQLLEELQLPPPVVGFGLAMIGPTLLDYGTEAQKSQHLPGITRGEIRWCQGYSEPGAGSDLASLSCQAADEGDHFVINGQKVWTSHADKSDWIFCLVRTGPKEPKRAGITFLLIDMASPGVTARPIPLISGSSPFCEVFFDEVRVPKANVIGSVNEGWPIAKALLGYERGMIGEAMGGELVGVEATLAKSRAEALRAPGRRESLARWAMEERCFRVTLERIAQQMKAGQNPGTLSSIMKVVGSELKQQRWQLEMDLAGPEGLGWSGESFAAEDLDITREWLRSRGNSIEGGSTEIQLNIIATRVLGLPR